MKSGHVNMWCDARIRLWGTQVSSCGRWRSQPFPEIGPAVFTGGNILLGADPRIPPHALGLGPVLGEEEFKFSFAIIARLLPGALPKTVGILCGDESSTVLGIGAVAGFVECGLVALVVLHLENFPFPAQVRDDGLAG